MLMKILRKIIMLIVILCIIVFLGVSVYVYNVYIEVKKEVDNGKVEKTVSEIMLKENYVKKEDIDKKYLEAVVQVEDHRYYSHGPVDTISLIRSIITNLESKKIVEGGSTITQQVSKNIFLNQKQDIKRKIKEVFYSIELEKRYDKDTILEIYVNTSYFGAGFTGIKNASVGYFGKEPLNLTINEYTFLAGVPNAPSVYNPYSNNELAKKRRNIVADKLKNAGMLTKDEAEKVKQEEIEVKKKNN